MMSCYDGFFSIFQFFLLDSVGDRSRSNGWSQKVGRIKETSRKDEMK